MPQEIKFPDSFDDDESLYSVVNNLRTRLTSDITDSITTIPVLSTIGFPDVGFVTILTGVDITNAEAIAYSGTGATDFLNAERGTDGTIAVEHSLNDAVDHTIVSRHHNNIKDALIEVEQFLGVSGSENFPRFTDDGSILVPGRVVANGVTSFSVIVSGTLTADTVTVADSLTISGIAVPTEITLQNAYDFGDGTITTVAGTPVHIIGQAADGQVDFKVTGSGFLTEGLEVGQGPSSFLDAAGITALTGTFIGPLSFGEGFVGPIEALPAVTTTLDNTQHYIAASGTTPHNVSLNLSTSEHLESDEGQFNINNTWTIGVWVNRLVSSSLTILNIASGGTTVENRISIEGNTDSTWSIELRSASGDSGTGVKFYITPNAAVGTGWHFLTITWNEDSQTLKLYTDGVEDPSPTAGPDQIVAQDDSSVNRGIAIGARKGSSSNWEGKVYQTQIWNVVLSDDEIAELYANGNPRNLDLLFDFGDYVSSSDLVHWYRHGINSSLLDEDEGVGSARDLDTNSVGISAADIDNDAPGTADAFTLILPDPTLNTGREYIIRNTGIAVLISGANNTSVDRTSLDADVGAATFISDGKQWRTVSLITTTTGVVTGGTSTLQEAYDNGDGTISTTGGKPFELTGTGELTAVTGTFTTGLTIGQASTILLDGFVTTVSGIFSESLTVSGVPVQIGAGGSSSTLQDAYDNGDGTISIAVGKPFALTGTGELTAVTGTFSQSLTVSGLPVQIAAVAPSSLTVKEQDGSPSVSNVTTIQVSDGTLTNEGGGIISLTTGGGGSGGADPVSISGTGTSYFVPDAPPLPSSATVFNDEFDQNPIQTLKIGKGVPLDSGKWTLFDPDGARNNNGVLDGVFMDGLHFLVNTSTNDDTWVGEFQDIPTENSWQIVTKVGFGMDDNVANLNDIIRIGLFIGNDDLIDNPTTAD